MSNKEIKNFRKVVFFGTNLLRNYLNVHAANYKEEKDKHTEHVYRENLTLLESERVHIERTIEYIKNLDYSKFDSAEEYKTFLLDEIKKFHKKHGFPNVCYIILSEKIEKCWEFYQEFCDFE